MSQQGPILVVSSGKPLSFATALAETKLFPMVDAVWSDAAQAIARLQPAAVLADGSDAVERVDVVGARLWQLAQQVAAQRPYVPLLVIDPKPRLPVNAIPFSQAGGSVERLSARLRAALRIRTLHATVLRRLDAGAALAAPPPETDPLDEATVLLIGRGGAYPALSVAFGERLGVVGALSIEAAAKHLNARELDGVVLAEGFSPRVVDAFLTVLAEDARFRHLPVVVTFPGLAPTYDLPNLELVSGEPAGIAASALPLIRQHAFEARLRRTMTAIDSDGLLDPRTGLMTRAAFDRDFATSVHQTASRGSGLTVARFSFDRLPLRVQLDAARILTRLMRRMDFATLADDGSLIVVFAETGLREAQVIAKRLSSVMKHTLHGPKRESRADPHVALITSQPADSASSILARLDQQDRHRAAS
jgi:GGDEF domain-containing protein